MRESSNIESTVNYFTSAKDIKYFINKLLIFLHIRKTWNCSNCIYHIFLEKSRESWVATSRTVNLSLKYIEQSIKSTSPTSQLLAY